MLTLKSPAFTYGAPIPARYTCDGDDIHPPLVVAGVPEGTASLALIVDDPDSPTGTWVHWTLWNIPPATAEFPAGEMPTGAVEGMTTFGRTGYGGPCPHTGEHRYVWKLYALDTRLELPPSTTADELTQAMEGHVLERSELLGLYQRP